MITKPNLPCAMVCKDQMEMKKPSFMTEAAWQAFIKGKGKVYVGSETGDFGVGATFKILEYEYAYDSHGFKCEGTKNWISLFKMSGGCNHLKEFTKPGAEKSHDYDIIPTSRILDLPLDRMEAKDIVEMNYIDKTLRVIASSAEGRTQYGGRYYLFAIED